MTALQASVLPLLGVVIFAALAATTLIEAREQAPVFVLLAGVAATAYAAALWVAARGPTPSGRLLVACLLLAAAGRVPLLVGPPALSDDIYRYVWDGRVQRFGLSPYAAAPADPGLDHLHTDVTRRADHGALPTIYPPAAQWFFRAVTSVHESPGAMKLALVLCEVPIVLLLLRWPVRAAGGFVVLAYAWNPLVVLEVAGNGHIDVLGAMLLVAAALALRVQRSLAATLLFAAAVGVKLLPVVLAPLLWRRVRLGDAACGAALLGALYLPFAGPGLAIPTGSLGAYLTHWRFNGPLFGGLEPLVGLHGALGLGLLAACGTAVWARQRLPVNDASAWAWPMAVALLFMPTVYPWYLLWLAPFLGSPGTIPLAGWTLTSLLTYLVWANVAAGAGWTLPAWVVPVQYGAVAATGLAVALSLGARKERSRRHVAERQPAATP